MFFNTDTHTESIDYANKVMSELITKYNSIIPKAVYLNLWNLVEELCPNIDIWDPYQIYEKNKTFNNIIDNLITSIRQYDNPNENNQKVKNIIFNITNDLFGYYNAMSYYAPRIDFREREKLKSIIIRNSIKYFAVSFDFKQCLIAIKMLEERNNAKFDDSKYLNRLKKLNLENA